MYRDGYSHLVPSGHHSIETEIVVQRKWSVIFKNLVFTPKNYYKLLFIRLFILFQQTQNKNNLSKRTEQRL